MERELKNRPDVITETDLGKPIGCYLGMSNREIFEAFTHYFNTVLAKEIVSEKFGRG